MNPLSDNTLNVLFLGGAKRVSFGRKLISAGKDTGIEVKIYSYELTPWLPIATLGPVIIGRRWSDPDIMNHLHEIVTRYDIHVILPFVDAAVGMAGEYCVSHPGKIWSPVVEPALAEILFDKGASAELFEKVHLDIPHTYVSGRPVFPLIAKPRHGSASKGIEIVNDVTDFRRILRQRDRYLLQTYYPEREEYTVDCYVNMHGEILCVSPRRRLEVLGGEVTRTVTVDAPEITARATEAINRLGLKGAVTLQYLRDIRSQRLMLMEINPRLGGGVVCSIHAGADIPRMIVDEATGRKPCPAKNIEPGTFICRYFDEVVFHDTDF